MGGRERDREVSEVYSLQGLGFRALAELRVGAPSGAAFGLPSPGAADELPRATAHRSSSGCHPGLLGAERVQLDLRRALVANRQKCASSHLSKQCRADALPRLRCPEPYNPNYTLLNPKP